MTAAVDLGPATQPLAQPSRPPWPPHAVAAVGVGVTSGGCVWGALHVSASATVHDVALFSHLAALVVGFGAVLSVDWVALQWALGRRRLEHVLEVAAAVAVPIWLGYAGLVASGVLLEPDVSSVWTRLKLGLVVVIGVNGVLALWLHRLLEKRPSRMALVVGAGCATVSQVCWWAATVVGHVNAH